MDALSFIHDRLFFAQMVYSFIIGIYAAWLSAGKKPLSGNFFGTIAVYAVLNTIIFVMGIVLLIGGYTIEGGGRVVIYILYMLFLIVILPGLFSIMSGRDDRSAGLTFGMFAMFNAAVSFSMVERGLATWIATL